jgi:hypothetical protein
VTHSSLITNPNAFELTASQLARWAERYRDWPETLFSVTKPRRRQRKLRADGARKPRPPDGLLTRAQAAAKLNCSLRTLDGHVASGALRYVAIGHGKKRPRRMFTVADLDEFISNQTRKDVPCPSSATRARHIGGSTSNSKVIAFSAAPRPRPGAKRKP